MEVGAEKFLDLMDQLENLTDHVTPERAHAELDPTTLQLCWQRWPYLSAGAGSLWRLLSEELDVPGAPHQDPELDEVGGSE